MSTRLSRTAITVTSLATALALTGAAQPATAASDPFGDQAAAVVFYPNPVQQLGIQTLTDNKDADDAVFGPAYRQVTLTDLDNSGMLTGRYVTVKSKTGTPARRDGAAFPVWHRDADQFEQVMGYYW
ncbi:MAG TPA: hypothetical protein VFE14_06555, partial [Micromonosporaceae bacterium]|nr:hypothetical protein [Micromonosporaceae bacterium]